MIVLNQRQPSDLYCRWAVRKVVALICTAIKSLNSHVIPELALFFFFFLFFDQSVSLTLKSQMIIIVASDFGNKYDTSWISLFHFFLELLKKHPF